MGFKLTIMKKAEKDLEWFRRNSKPDYVKCFDLLRNTAQSPRDGIGQPERLKHHEDEV